MSRVDPTMRDQGEISFWVGMQDQHASLCLDRQRGQRAFNRLMHEKPPGGSNKVANLDTEVRLREDDMAILNRSPTTNITNHHGIPGWAVLSLLAAIVLALALIGGVIWALYRVPSDDPDAPSVPLVSKPVDNDFAVGFFDN